MKYTETSWITIIIGGNKLFRKKLKKLLRKERGHINKDNIVTILLELVTPVSYMLHVRKS